MSPQGILDRLFRRERLDGSMEEELRFHIEERASDLERSGIPAEEARRRAHLEFGGIENYKEQCRQVRRFNGLHGFLADLRFGLRMLRRSPGFSLLAILCLTLGIGANAAVFSWIEGTLLRPYPAVAHQENLYVLAGTARGVTGYDGTSWPDFLDLQRNSHIPEAFIAEKITGATITEGDRPQRATGSLVSANYFDALGIRPILGRGFQAGEDVGRNAHPVVVISHQFWRDRYRGDRDIVGKTLVLNSVPYTIVGVTPPDFYGTFVGYSWQFWAPISMQERFDSSGYKLEDRGARWIEGFVRLRPGTSLTQAQQELSAVTQRLETDYPTTNRGRGIRLLPLWDSPFNASSDIRPTLKITAIVTFFVLLIACANVSNLLLVRSFARRHEMTVRLAVGAARARLLKQLLTEGLILSILASLGGLLMAYWCRNLLVALLPIRSAGVPLRIAGQTDWRVLGMSAGICLLSTLLFGVFPAFQTSNVDIASALKCESAGVVGGRGRSWLRWSLVLVQVSLSFVLLVGAGLLMQSLQKIHHASPGFATDDVLVTSVNLFDVGYDDGRTRNLQDQLLEQVQGMSSVESASYARVRPFSYVGYSNAPIATDVYRPGADDAPTVDYDEVAPNYFSTIGIPLIEGRDFARSDDPSAPPVAVVNEAMAAWYWRGQDPVGKRLQVGDKWMVVIGVAKNAKYRKMLEPDKPFFYVALSQNPSRQVSLFVRTRRDKAGMARALGGQIHALDPNLPLYEVISMREQVDRQTSTQQVAGMLLAIFGGLALLLATIGLYGVMSYAVSQSTRELGLRIALGAAPSDLLRLVLSRGMALTGIGVALGLLAALALTRLLGYLLYNMSPRDPLSFGSAVLVITLASLMACFFPAWRATRTDPLNALREA